MAHLHKYVPKKEYIVTTKVPEFNETAEVTKAKLYSILFGGDQLTAARARRAKKFRVNSITPSKCLDGLIPVCEDWHAKVILIEVTINFSMNKGFDYCFV